MVDGLVDVVVFNDDGGVADVVELGIDKNFYYRLDLPRYHTLLVHSPVLVIHEITNGPFDLKMSDFAPFSPVEGDSIVSDYIYRLKLQVQTWKKEFDGRV